MDDFLERVARPLRSRMSRNKNDGFVFELFHQVVQMRHGFDARTAPSCPKFQHHHFSFQLFPAYFSGRRALYRFGQGERRWNIADFRAVFISNRKRITCESSKKAKKDENDSENFHNTLGSNLSISNAKPLVAVSSSRPIRPPSFAMLRRGRRALI